MPNTDQSALRNVKSYAAALLLGVMLVGAGMLVVLGTQVQRELEILRSASSDNVQWNLSQLEVDLIVFQVALEAANHSDANAEEVVNDIRRRFDALYSRVNTLSKGKLFAELRSEIEITNALTKIDVFLQETAIIIDGADTQLLSSTQRISDRVRELRLDARTIAISGIKIFGVQSKEQRAFLSKLLLRVSLLAGAMILAMAGSLFILFRQFGATQRESARRLQANARLRSTVGASLDAVIVADREGKVVGYNGAAANIFGYTRDEAMGQYLSDLIIPNRFRTAHKEGMERFLSTGNKTVLDSGLVQLVAIRKTGDEFPVEISIASANGPDGIIFVSFIRDISERLEVQNELTTARDNALAADKAKSNFLAVMSHEMRTPLNGIMGTLDLMGSTPLTPIQAKYISVATKSGNILLRHINDVLDITKAEAGPLELSDDVFAPETIVEDVISTSTVLAQARGNVLSLQNHLEGGTFIKSDSFRLQQILVNFVGNAIKFTSNGTITIEINLIDDGNTIEFRVIDDGIGVSKKNLARVFEDFVTVDASYGRQAGGTGLGLGICRRMAKAIGAEIGAESVIGTGSEFWLHVPFVEPTEDEIQSHVTAPSMIDMPETSTQKLSILVVEDNQINRFVVRAILENMGHTVDEATDGLEGVHMAAQTRFDVILMDVSMPVMDGVTATRKIRELGEKSADAVIIGLTAHAIVGEQETFLEAGMNICLTKPVSSTKLSKILNQYSLPHDMRILDEAVLDDMISLLGVEKFEITYRRYVTEVSENIATLSVPTNEAEFEHVQLLAHKLSGSAATFGATALRECLSSIEMHCEAGNSDSIPAAYTELKRVWSTTLRQYEEITGINLGS